MLCASSVSSLHRAASWRWDSPSHAFPAADAAFRASASRLFCILSFFLWSVALRPACLRFDRRFCLICIVLLVTTLVRPPAVVSSPRFCLLPVALFAVPPLLAAPQEELPPVALLLSPLPAAPWMERFPPATSARSPSLLASPRREERRLNRDETSHTSISPASCAVGPGRVSSLGVSWAGSDVRSPWLPLVGALV